MFTSGKDKSGKEKGGGEEKRKHIKSMIDKIPTSKEELFAYPIDSSLVDNVSVPSNFFVIIIIIIFFYWGIMIFNTWWVNVISYL